MSSAEVLYGDMSLLRKAPRQERFFETPKAQETARPREKTWGVPYNMKRLRDGIVRTLAYKNADFLRPSLVWQEEYDQVRLASYAASSGGVTNALRTRLVGAAKAIGMSKVETLTLQNDLPKLYQTIEDRTEREHADHAEDWHTLKQLLTQVNSNIVSAETPARLAEIVQELPNGHEIVTLAYRQMNLLRSRLTVLSATSNRETIYPEDLQNMYRMASGLLSSTRKLKSMLSLKERRSMAEKLKEETGAPKGKTLTELQKVAADVTSLMRPMQEIRCILSDCKKRASRIALKDKAIQKAQNVWNLAEEIWELAEGQIQKLKGTPYRGEGYLAPTSTTVENVRAIRKEGNKYVALLEGIAKEMRSALEVKEPAAETQQKAA